MTYTTSVTQKGQITIPKSLRDLLGIDKYDQVKISSARKNKTLVIEKAPDLVDMAGTLEIDPILLKKFPLEKAREELVENYGKSARSRL